MRFSLLLLILVFVSAQEEEEEYYSEEEEDIPIDLSSLQSFLNDLYYENSSVVNTTFTQDLEHLHFLFGGITEAVVRAVFPVVSETLQSSEISSDCFATLLALLRSFRRQEEWPLKCESIHNNISHLILAVVDSSARFPFSGLLEGRISDFGEFEECLRIREVVNSREIKGMYCLVAVSLQLPEKPSNLRFHSSLVSSNTSLKNTLWQTVADNAKLFYIARGLRLGVCLPNSCSANDLQVLFQGIASTLRLEIRLPEECQQKDHVIQWTTPQKTSVFVISVLTLLSIVCSFAPKRNAFFRIFALTQSTRRLFLNNTQSKRLASVHGLRVVAIVWILLGHVYLMQFWEVFHVLRGILVDMPRLSWIRYQPLKLGSFLQVDTFLLLGGTTASYVTLEVLSSLKRFDWFAFLILRWLRYTPAVVGLILFYFLLPHLASGPIFEESIAVMTTPCEHFWWRNLLYINNFYDATGNCATHTWYLAADFQYYALSPIFILLLKRHKIVGICLTVLTILSGAFLSILAPLLDSSLSPSMYSLDILLSEEDIQRHFRKMYWSPLQHVSPYFMGILLGFLIHKYHSWKVPKSVERLLWVTTCLSGISTIFWTTNWMNSSAKEETPSYYPRLLFHAFYKITWTVLPFWLVLTSAFNRGGVIGRFLSSGLWVPFSRLTYCVYLVQLIPIVLRAYSVRYVQPFDDFYNLSLATFALLLSILLAFVLFVLFESPFSECVKLLFKRK